MILAAEVGSEPGGLCTSIRGTPSSSVTWIATVHGAVLAAMLTTVVQSAIFAPLSSKAAPRQHLVTPHQLCY